jgi:hypothetical protein
MTVKPVILTKGTVKIAIYGIGNIKDERLHEVFLLLAFTLFVQTFGLVWGANSAQTECRRRLQEPGWARRFLSTSIYLCCLSCFLLQSFRKEKVKFEIPSPKEDYFHILVIHQNRYALCSHLAILRFQVHATGLQSHRPAIWMAGRTKETKTTFRQNFCPISSTLSSGATNMSAESSQKKSSSVYSPHAPLDASVLAAAGAPLR